MRSKPSVAAPQPLMSRVWFASRSASPKSAPPPRSFGIWPTPVPPLELGAIARGHVGREPDPDPAVSAALSRSEGSYESFAGAAAGGAGGGKAPEIPSSEPLGDGDFSR